jgi:eukaryotic-like serine/threonine-protein kinase
MPEAEDSQSLVGAIHATSGAKVVVVNKLVGNLYAGVQEVVSPDVLRTQRQSQDQRNRLAAIRRIRSDWIDGFLRQSLANIATIELRLTPQQSAVTLGLNTIVQTPGDLPAAITSSMDITTIFDSFDQALLILGAPGSGKTTLLLQLADELLRRAEEDLSQRIPVVFNLSSWAVKRRELSAWMADEMNQRNEIPKRIAKEWIANDQIIPLLDGLDEVDPAQRLHCLEEINRFRSERGFLPIAVCSRLADYESLGEKLRLRSAVVVQQLEDHDIELALSANAELGGLRAAARTDPAFAEILRTPLMLWIAALAYRGASGTIATDEKPEGIRKRLFGAYVDAMFRRRGPVTRYKQPDMLRWLVRLADAQRRNNLTIFTLEALDSNFMPTRTSSILSRLAVIIGVTLVYAIVCVLIAAGGYVLTGAILAALKPGSVNWGDQYGYIGFVGLITAFILAPAMGILAGFARLSPSEKISLSFRKAFTRIVPALKFTVIFYFLLKFMSLIMLLINLWGSEDVSCTSASGNYDPSGGMVGSMFDACFPRTLHGFADFFLSDFEPRNLFSLSSPFFIVLICGILRLLLADTSEVRSKCNQGTWRSARIALGAAAAVLVLGSVIALHEGLLNWIFLASLIAGLAGGAYVMKHLVLRFVVWAARLGPLNYAAFLNQATERILLRRVGGGYVFTHRALQEYFASRTDWLKSRKAEPAGGSAS